jgi:peptidyl-prolyl cis-trans isomerase B (cyclophilin B)
VVTAFSDVAVSPSRPVSSSRDQQLARLRARRRAERAHQRTRHRQIVAGVLAAVLVLAVGGVIIGVVVSSGGGKNSASVQPPATTAPATTAPAQLVACGGQPQTLAPATRTWKTEPALTIDTKATYTMTLTTSCGDIVIPLEAAKAPHTVNLLNFLAAQNYYNGSVCPREATSASLTILQCGDANNGDGTGSIGFSIQEENLTGATYPRGTLAIANTGAKNSSGSQFFLVDKDSQLPPSYTVVGHISQGLDVLDKLMAVGDDGSNAAGGGKPKQTIYLDKVVVTKS